MAEWNPSTNVPDLTGKVAVVTGGSAGVGLGTARHLALKGAKVYFTARSEAKAKSAKEQILAGNSNVKEDQVVWLPLDLEDLKSVSKAVDELKAKEPKVHILVNNGGLAGDIKRLETTESGWERSFAVNHVGHFVFTNGLVPLLKAAAADKDADVRVVTVSSAVSHLFIPPSYPVDLTSRGAFEGKIAYEPMPWRIQKHLGFQADVFRYAISKLANVLFAKELQQRFDERGLPIISVSIHPGLVNTGGAQGLFPKWMKPIMPFAFLSADKGCWTSLFAATAKEVREKPKVFGGAYLEPFGAVKPNHKISNDEKQLKGLWSLTAEEANKVLTGNGLAPVHEW